MGVSSRIEKCDTTHWYVRVRVCTTNNSFVVLCLVYTCVMRLSACVCVAVLLFGSVGMFAMFLITDRNARLESELPEHASEKRDEKPA